MKLKTFWERLVRVLRQHISLTIIVVAALLLELTTGVQNYYAQSMIQNLVESYIGSEMRGNSLQIQNQLAKVMLLPRISGLFSTRQRASVYIESGCCS